MKILTISFKNLNSLYGTWHLDLTHKAYQAETLFIICGPTGSGKTTLLDAVCLALYGKTPRLDVISKSTNEIMSRQTGECFAEVTFETGKGQFRCHWSQHRSRKKPDGELQQPRHELVEAGSGRILESGIRNVARAIEETTGMDFKQFTRSVLLAQGHFAEFLLASADERAPLLEQITGTELYSDISIQVHKRTNQEQEKLKFLKRDLEGIELFDTEQRAALEKVAQNSKVETETARQRMQLCLDEKNWLESLKNLEKDILELSEETEQLRALLEMEQPVITQLESARKAQFLKADYTALQDKRKRQEQDLRQLEEVQSQRNSIEQEYGSCLNQLKELTREVEQTGQRRKELSALLKKVRELDAHIKHGREQKRQSEVRLAKAVAELDSLRNLIAAEEHKQAAGKTKLIEIENYLAKYREDESLAEELGSIKTQFDIYTKLISQQDQLESKIIEQTGEIELKSKLVSAKQDEIDNLQAKWKELAVELEQSKAKLATILDGRELSNLVETLLTLKDTKEMLSDWHDGSSQLHRLRKDLEELETSLTALEASAARQRHEEKKLVAAEQAKRRELTELTERLEQDKAVRSLEEQRKTLTPGHPCPLCGSTDHPYIENEPPDDMIRTSSRFEALENEHRQLLEILEQTRREIALSARDITHMVERKGEKERAKRELTTSLEPLSGKLRDSKLLPDTPEQAPEVLAGIEEQISKRKSQLSIAEVLHQEQRDLAERYEKRQRLLTTLQQDIGNVTRELENKATLRDGLRNEKAKLETDRLEIFDSLQERLSRYQLKDFDPEETGVAIAELEKRLAVWKNYQDSTRRLKEDIGNQELLLRERQARQQEREDEIRAETQHFKNVDAALTNLHDNRSDLFSDKDPDKEEEHFETQYETVLKLLENTREQKSRLENQQSILSERLQSLEKTIRLRHDEIKEAEDLFGEKLTSQGFESEHSLDQALLPDDTFNELEERIQSLYRRRDKNNTLRLDKEKSLEKEKSRQLSTRSLPEINEEIVEHNAFISQKEQLIGSILGKLEEDDKRRKQYEYHAKTLSRQEKELEVWLQLHRLIGSSDGKKFRNFAQGITFEFLIGSANRCLAGMSERYRLIHRKEKPLELDVVDKYQAGEIRSTRNLSGGESFIVSMALALGLSSMNSKNIQVDSLFLDEGFGTLDEDSLEIALTALASLRTEGKLIGIISHVANLRERIPIRIELQPGHGGRSSVSGPGIQHN